MGHTVENWRVHMRDMLINQGSWVTLSYLISYHYPIIYPYWWWTMVTYPIIYLQIPSLYPIKCAETRNRPRKSAWTGQSQRHVERVRGGSAVQNWWNQAFPAQNWTYFLLSLVNTCHEQKLKIWIKIENPGSELNKYLTLVKIRKALH